MMVIQTFYILKNKKAAFYRGSLFVLLLGNHFIQRTQQPQALLAGQPQSQPSSLSTARIATIRMIHQRQSWFIKSKQPHFIFRFLRIQSLQLHTMLFTQ